uniref:Transferred entry: 3.1.21.10 n=1 Tax=Heterorhabditis bacteriophora TaxID=37862 RepID=A0A1I7X1T5_HETBA
MWYSASVHGWKLKTCGTLDLDNSLSSEQCSFPSWQSKSESLQYDVLVLHPKIRWGSESPSRLKIGHLQLAEAIALVNTLPNFRVVESAIVGVDYNTKRKSVWGTGQIKSLVKLKHQNRVSAVMVNIEILTPMQQVRIQVIKVGFYYPSTTQRFTLTDTIGFLSELPIHLLAAFEATLGHVKQAVYHSEEIENPCKHKIILGMRRYHHSFASSCLSLFGYIIFIIAF